MNDPAGAPRSASSGAPSEPSDTPAPPPIPTLSEAIETVRPHVLSRGAIVIFYLNFDRFSKIEEIYGWEKLDAVITSTVDVLRQMMAESSFRDAVIADCYERDDDLVVLHVPHPNAVSGDGAGVSVEMIRNLRDGVAARLEQQFGADVAALFDLYIGRTVVTYDPKVLLERQIYRGVREAASRAHNLEQQERVQLVYELRETLRSGVVYIDYHPIVDPATESVVGYEALARGTMRSLRRPEVMFEAAVEAGLLWELSRLCRSRAIEGMPAVLEDGQLLFLNIDPHDFADPTFTEKDLRVEDPRRVVIEITERIAIKDYPRFRDRIGAFRARGFRFAVDDAGSGYAGLGSIANLEPDFIKLDLSLITGIDRNFIKQDLVRSMVQFANDQNAKVIAEGVEREAEFLAVRELGVHLVQGFFLHQRKQFPHQLERPVART